MNENSKTTRRRFLEVVGSVTLCGGVACGNEPVPPDPIGDVPVGNVTDLAVGELRAVDTLPVCIGRDDKGVYAMTLTCPHEGCNMAMRGTVDFTGIYCRCHGSRFSNNGDVTKGPAEDDLTHFQVEIDADGNMTIHGGVEVSAGTRTPVA